VRRPDTSVAKLFDLPAALPPGQRKGRGRPPVYGKQRIHLAKRAAHRNISAPPERPNLLSTRRKSRPSEDRRESQRATPGLLTPRGLGLPEGPLPTVKLRSVSAHPHIYRRMLEQAEPSAQPGDLVQAVDRDGEPFGFGLYNPRSEIVLRMLCYGDAPPDEAFWQSRLEQAVELRRRTLKLDEVCDAYRVLHSEADGLPGIVVDRFQDVLSAEVYSLGMHQRAQAILVQLAGLCGTKHWTLSVDASVHGQEGFLAETATSAGAPRQATISEFGTEFRVNFAEGHKTGFFCDQRDNRRKLAQFCAGRSVLDLCCYTGGFAVQAKRLGEATEVTAVDLDETAVQLARENAQLNRLKIHFVHADAFAYMRDMLSGGRLYDVVVLDPPKLIRSRRELEVGTRKHFDLNRLAMQLVRPGGLLLSCSCSGLLGEAEFTRLLCSAARQAAPPGSTQRTALSGRRMQILDKTGASSDHPIAGNCPETEYLHAVWMRLE
jgi:23S rRNA (cytosine1962-C5)-methyltransferase